MSSPAKIAAAVLLLLAAAILPSSWAVVGYNGQPNNPGGAGFFGAGGMPSWFAGGGGGGGPGPGPGGFFAGGGGGGGSGPGGLFGGWGEGGLGYKRGAAVPPSVVCSEPGPCHGKRLTCPQRCFRSFSYQGAHGGGGGGGGGCSFDCSRCVASC